MIELKVEGFKPEFAGKMNFYLSAVDDHLRHPDDQPSIGIILCGSRNEIIVEYALRDSSKPMGVAQYRVSTGLPERLRPDLPTVEDLEHEFQSAAAIEVLNEVEYTLRDAAAAYDVPAGRPIALSSLLRELKQLGKAPPKKCISQGVERHRDRRIRRRFASRRGSSASQQLILSEMNAWQQARPGS